MNRLWFDLAFRRRVRGEIRRLGPWYQQIQLLPGLFTRPWNQATIGELIHAERGGPKFRRFLLPMIKPYLHGGTVFELGCNGAQMLVCCLRHGAAEAWGVEPDERYRKQACLVRQCLGLQRQLTISNRPPLGKSVDIGLMCAVLRHVDPLERVGVLQSMGEFCKRVLINGNGLSDAPDGDSIDSILRDVHRTNLVVEELRSEPHVRGLRILLKSR